MVMLKWQNQTITVINCYFNIINVISLAIQIRRDSSAAGQYVITLLVSTLIENLVNQDLAALRRRSKLTC